MRISQLLPIVLILSLSDVSALAADGAPRRKVLFVGQPASEIDSGVHQFMAGLHQLANCLKGRGDLEVSVVCAEEAWEDGPTLLHQTDGVVLFLDDGAKWIHSDPKRLEAFAQVAARGGGLVALHGAVHSSEERYVGGFLKLLGGCSAGPGSHQATLKPRLQVDEMRHPIVSGIKSFSATDRFYSRLKLLEGTETLRSVLRIQIENQPETVAWSWERSDGGRSFGFTGLHFHKNWELVEYRRLVAQALLWTLKIDVPQDGLPVPLDDGTND